jgi:hypothetical protein
MMASRYLSLLLAAVLLFPVTGNTGTVTTPGIVAKTTAAALSCMRWMPVGMCFWLRCSWTGCRVRTSIKIGHYNPDLVVSSYNELGGNPWVEIRATLGLAQKAAATGLLGALLPVPIDSAGNRTEGTAGNRDHKNMIFRETDAIGHPLSSLSGLVAGVGLLCQSQTTAFFPYFQSGLDALSWRQEVPGSSIRQVSFSACASWVPGHCKPGVACIRAPAGPPRPRNPRRRPSTPNVPAISSRAPDSRMSMSRLPVRLDFDRKSGPPVHW